MSKRKRPTTESLKEFGKLFGSEKRRYGIKRAQITLSTHFYQQIRGATI